MPKNTRERYDKACKVLYFFTSQMYHRIIISNLKSCVLVQTALLVAVTANQPEIVQDLLSLGADINACDVKGQTALHLAAHYGLPIVLQVNNYLNTKQHDYHSRSEKLYSTDPNSISFCLQAILSRPAVNLEARNFEGNLMFYQLLVQFK